jgi:hypothetical protein
MGTMNNVTKQLSSTEDGMTHGRAANADQIGEERYEQTVIEPESTSTGWDSYQVWRRFIKEARERRRPQG